MGQVILQRTGAVVRLLIDNPARRNAMSLAMWQELASLVHQAGADPDVRAILLRGTGERAFASGADISEFETQRGDAQAVHVYNAAVQAAEGALRDVDKPTVACIHGVCIGGGLGLALSCDLRYASVDARFRMPAARMALGYDYRDIRQMVQVIGAARAADLFYTARTVDAMEALRIGLVHQVWHAAELDARVDAILAQIADNAPLTLRAGKIAIRHTLADPPASHPAEVVQAVQDCFESADYVEGRRAFMDKRAPRFTGK